MRAIITHSYNCSTRRLLVDPAALTKGLDAWREEEESARGPLRMRIQAIDRRLAENRREWAQLLDQYLRGAVANEDQEHR